MFKGCILQLSPSWGSGEFTCLGSSSIFCFCFMLLPGCGFGCPAVHHTLCSAEKPPSGRPQVFAQSLRCPLQCLGVWGSSSQPSSSSWIACYSPPIKKCTFRWNTWSSFQDSRAELEYEPIANVRYMFWHCLYWLTQQNIVTKKRSSCANQNVWSHW